MPTSGWKARRGRTPAAPRRWCTTARRSSSSTNPPALPWMARRTTPCSTVPCSISTSRGNTRRTSLYTPALCHRLDTGTSGLVIIAKTPEAEELFLAAIKNRDVQKTYLCVTFGRPTPPDATLGGYLLKDADRGIVKIVEDKQPGAKEVETQYETIAVSGRLALLKVKLITGRTHQIRAHMASIGCPILGDSKYGNNAANRELKLKYQALCAWELTMPRFTQPDFAVSQRQNVPCPEAVVLPAGAGWHVEIILILYKNGIFPYFPERCHFLHHLIF